MFLSKIRCKDEFAVCNSEPKFVSQDLLDVIDDIVFTLPDEIFECNKFSPK